MTTTPALERAYEEAAKAVYEISRAAYDLMPWEDQPEPVKDKYRRFARTSITAFQSSWRRRSSSFLTSPDAADGMSAVNKLISLLDNWPDRMDRAKAVFITDEEWQEFPSLVMQALTEAIAVPLVAIEARHEGKGTDTER